VLVRSEPFAHFAPAYLLESFVVSATDPHELYAAAEQLMDDGQLELAVEQLQRVLAADSGFTLAHLALARVLTKLGRHLEAIEHGLEACKLEPDDPFSFTALSVTYQRAWAGTKEQRYIQMAEDAMARARQLESQR
jgi:tetratricopeptide (TPR) repeat protein